MTSAGQGSLSVQVTRWRSVLGEWPADVVLVRVHAFVGETFIDGSVVGERVPDEQGGDGGEEDDCGEEDDTTASSTHTTWRSSDSVCELLVGGDHLRAGSGVGAHSGRHASPQ